MSVKRIILVFTLGLLVISIFLLGYDVGSIYYSTESCKEYKEKALTSPFYNDTME